MLSKRNVTNISFVNLEVEFLEVMNGAENTPPVDLAPYILRMAQLRDEVAARNSVDVRNRTFNERQRRHQLLFNMSASIGLQRRRTHLDSSLGETPEQTAIAEASIRHYDREAMSLAELKADDVKPEPKFSAVGQDVKQGRDTTIARAASGNMAKRIANALNAYTPDKRGQ